MEFQHSYKNILRDNEEMEKPLTANNSPPSSSSLSPVHEFSFTISLHHHSPAPTTTSHGTSKHPPPPSSSAVDLSPADDIFFHGHLLPLHLLSHLSISPRSSTNDSLDNFTLPIKDLLLQDQNRIPHTTKDVETPDKHKPKSRFKPFSSLFGLPKWRKGCDPRERADGERHFKMPKFDVDHVVKRYMKMVKPLLSNFRGSRMNKNFRQFHHQPCSFSGNLSSRGKQDDLRGGRIGGQYSAPASVRTSPTNSGLLVATPLALSTSTNDSTMEELQAAIQAAITHCKNSIAVESSIKCQD